MEEDDPLYGHVDANTKWRGATRADEDDLKRVLDECLTVLYNGQLDALSEGAKERDAAIQPQIYASPVATLESQIPATDVPRQDYDQTQMDFGSPMFAHNETALYASIIREIECDQGLQTQPYTAPETLLEAQAVLVDMSFASPLQDSSQHQMTTANHDPVEGQHLSVSSGDVTPKQRSIDAAKCSTCYVNSRVCKFELGEEKCDYCFKQYRDCRPRTDEDEISKRWDVTKKLDAQQKQAIRKKQDKDRERKLRNAQKCSQCRGKSAQCNFQPGAKRCDNCIMRRRGCRPSTDKDDRV